MTSPGKCLACGGRGQNCVCDLLRERQLKMRRKVKERKQRKPSKELTAALNSFEHIPAIPEQAAEYQTVVLTLSDGRRGSFTGPVLVEKSGTVRLTSVQFTFPKKLPAGAKFAKIGE